MRLEQKILLGSPLYLALNSVHGVAFHRGLGEPLSPTSSVPIAKYIDAPGIADFADAAYARSNIAVVANGASHSELNKWVKEFFDETSTGSSSVKIQSPASKYYGGEERIAHGSGNALIIAFPGSPAFTAGSGYKPEIAVLSALLGGESAIKWSPGFSILSNAAAATPGANVVTNHAAYSDAGLLYVTLTGKASDIGKAATSVVDAIKKVASGDVSEEAIKKAIASAKFRALEAAQLTDTGLEATGNGLIGGGKPFQIEDLAKGFEGVSKDKVVKVCSRSRLFVGGTYIVFMC
jgi:ubiquinol-cytochrome c reductase core subunit 2